MIRVSANKSIDRSQYLLLRNRVRYRCHALTKVHAYRSRNPAHSCSLIDGRRFDIGYQSENPNGTRETLALIARVYKSKAKKTDHDVSTCTLCQRPTSFIVYATYTSDTRRNRTRAPAKKQRQLHFIISRVSLNFWRIHEANNNHSRCSCYTCDV